MRSGNFGPKVTGIDRFHCINTNRFISANQPDIVIHDTSNRSVILLDIAIPADFKIELKEQKKISKY